jgi:hypothetical protein
MSHIWIMIAQRLGLGLVTLFVVSLIIFLGTELLPGDFAQEILGQSATPETVAALRERLGLNDPMHVRYINWLSDVARGDLGESLANGQSVADLIGRRLGNTLALALRGGHRGAAVADAGHPRGAVPQLLLRPVRQCLRAHLDLLPRVLRGLHPDLLSRRCGRCLPVHGQFPGRSRQWGSSSTAPSCPR